MVFTGGEPGLQLDEKLVEELHKQNCFIAIETNGTVKLPNGIDWVCVSPKANSDIILKKGNELKLVFPQPTMMPKDCKDWGFDHFYLQPMDSEEVEDHTKQAIKYIRSYPQWKLSIQTHKILGIL